MRTKHRFAFGQAAAGLLMIVVLSAPAADTQAKPNPAAATVTGTDAKRWALLIGVTAFTEPDTRLFLDELSGPSNDVRLISEALINKGRFMPEHVRVLADGTANPPTHDNIIRALYRVTREVEEDGVLLIFFAGHGIAPDGKGYLLPSNVIGVDDPANASFQSTALAVSELQRAIEASRARHVVLMLDACRNDPFSTRPRSRGGPGQAAESVAFTKAFGWTTAAGPRQREIVTIFSTQPGQRAYESGTEPKAGYFADTLAGALRGEAARAMDGAGEVTVGTLLGYLPDAVDQRVRKALGAKFSQRPYFVVQSDTSVLLTSPGPIKIGPPEPPGPPPPPPPPPAPAQLRFRVAARALEDPGLVVTRNYFVVNPPSLSAPVAVTPGKQFVQVRLPRYHDWSQDYDLAAGASAEVEVKLEPRRDRFMLALGAAGLGIGATAIGAYFWLRSSDLSSQISNSCQAGMPCDWGPGQQDRYNESQHDATLAKVFLGTGIPVAAAGLGAAAYFYFSARPLTPEATQVAVIPSSGGGGAVTLSRRW